jgi:hypothetical protein
VKTSEGKEGRKKDVKEKTRAENLKKAESRRQHIKVERKLFSFVTIPQERYKTAINTM